MLFSELKEVSILHPFFKYHLQTKMINIDAFLQPIVRMIFFTLLDKKTLSRFLQNALHPENFTLNKN